MADDDDSRSLAQWATEGLQPDPTPPAPEPVEPATPEPVAETPVEEPVAAEPEEAVEPAAPDPAAEAPKPAKPKPKPLEPWVKDRLAEVTAKQREAERRAADAEARAQVAEAEAAAFRRKQAAAPTDPNAPPPASNVETLPSADRPRPGYVPESEVETRAAAIASQNAMNAKADQTFYAGKAAHTDFEDAITPLREMGAFTRPEFYQAVFATDAPHDVIYHLGSNPNEASRIVGLLKSGDAIKAAVELARIDAQLGAERAAKPAPAKPGSKAPAPIKPVGGSANPATPPADKMDDEQFTSELDSLAKAKGWY